MPILEQEIQLHFEITSPQPNQNEDTQKQQGQITGHQCCHQQAHERIVCPFELCHGSM
jgi:hypothetical protein